MKPLRILLTAALVPMLVALGACRQDAGTASPARSQVAASPAAASPAAGRASADDAASASARRCVVQPEAASSSAQAKPASDRPMPSLRVTTFDCETFDLAEQRGRWVIVNFWATWCGPCLQEIPDLTRFVRARSDVTAIGLDSEDGIDAVTLGAFIRQHTPGYPIAVIDPYHPPADFESPRALPTSYLIGPDGKVVHKFLGPITFADLERMVGPPKPKG